MAAGQVPCLHGCLDLKRPSAEGNGEAFDFGHDSGTKETAGLPGFLQRRYR